MEDSTARRLRDVEDSIVGLEGSIEDLHHSIAAQHNSIMARFNALDPSFLKREEKEFLDRIIGREERQDTIGDWFVGAWNRLDATDLIGAAFCVAIGFVVHAIITKQRSDRTTPR